MGEPRFPIGARGSNSRSRLPSPKLPSSPYHGVAPGAMVAKTCELIDAHPLDPALIVEVVRGAWRSIFESRIGAGYEIGRDIFLQPQSMSLLLHELIPLEFERALPGTCAASRKASEKDLVYLPDNRFSCEIKASSSRNQIFGNRSYAVDTDSEDKKEKTGYYLAVNFDGFVSVDERPERQIVPDLRLIRFGWLDHTDWTSQAKQTGQQANLAPRTENEQLLVLWGLGAD